MPSGVIDILTGGSSSAADAQANAARESNAMQKQMFDKSLELLSGYRDLGDLGLAGMTGLMTPEGQQQFLDDYYQSGQFLTQSDAARNQQLAASEATGGLQSTSTQNQLARIAPDLGFSALQNQQNMYGNAINTGLSGAGRSAGYAQNYGNQYAQNMATIGQANANKALAQGDAIGSIIGAGLGLF